LSHEVLDLVSEFLVHSLFKLDAINGASITDDDVLAIVGVIKDELELSQVGATDELVVMLLAQESLLKCSDDCFRVSVVEIEVDKFPAKHLVFVN
jgi:hypothetical protein